MNDAEAAGARAPARVQRLVALGASNLTCGFAAAVHTAREAFGEPLEVVAAFGLGRSYGMRSSVPYSGVPVRSLPGILEAAIWDRLDAAPRVPTRALVTDVGNDVAYGVPVDTLVAWVEECVRRLQALGADVVLADLPLDGLRRLSNARFLAFRALVAPCLRLPLAAVRERAFEVSRALLEMARRRGLRFVPLKPEWYGLVDPIHIRPRFWAQAWRQIVLAGVDGTPAPASEPGVPIGAARLWLATPERQWLCGLERRRPQPAVKTPGGTAVWLY